MSGSSIRADVWRARLADWWSLAWRWVMMAAGAGLGAYYLLDQRAGNGVLTAAAIGVFVIGTVLTFSQPMAIALMSMPALFITERLGMGGVDISVSDVALAAAFGTAVLLAQRPFSPPLRNLLLLNLFYQFATIFTVIINPQAQNTVEWFHAWLLISGALIVGWALGIAGFARTAFILMIAAASVLAIGVVIAGVVQYAGGNFEAVYPTWPWRLQKNTVGTLLSFAILILYVNPPWAKISSAASRPLLLFLGIALLMTQSRQALIGLLIAVVVVAMRHKATGRSRLALLLLIPGIWLVVATVIEQIESQNQFNSFFQRLNWMREVYAFWKHSPIFGHGLRFWYYEPAVPYQPPNGAIEVAASSGVVGLAAFLIMWAGIVIVLWRVNPVFGTLAVAATLSRFVQGQFDIFWVTAQVSIPFVIAGICLGAMAREERQPASLSAPTATTAQRRPSYRPSTPRSSATAP